MWQIFKQTNYQFIKYTRIWVSLSILAAVVSIGAYVAKGGFNYGIDFAGGTQLTLKFSQKPNLNEMRKLMGELNMGDVVIQEFDEEGLNEIMIRIENTGEEGDIAGSVLSHLHQQLSPGAGEMDLNFMGRDALAQNLESILPGRDEEAEQVAAAVASFKKSHGIITSMDDLSREESIPDDMASILKEKFTLGSFALMGAENVGPKVGKDLRSKAQSAIIWSLFGMLFYIWIRFRHFAYGFGAIVATFHDVIITLGVFVVLGLEINLTVVAALLTLVGYSVNDTVVVFDRIRETLRKSRRQDFPTLVNQAINETLSRTIITSGTTFLTVLSLYILGGDVIRNFAFTLVIGIFIGTYSSIYIASPVVIFIHKFAERKRQAKRK
ncbi:MAG TPA: protein translocase subunit SecF [Thermoanaerobaculia bacterium]|nr:protein translocase subunit SecF [Thermoanaerobaculia bacterium]HUM30475.1 protein translocase subunit SecF [Thermoanaerobaculia bacterium]HXK68658.1 protein translocase subunit SecF [Thermoanaerobaculia bacterium]